MNNIGLIVSREYSTRVKKKAFIFTTLLMPVVFLALMFAPMLLQGIAGSAPDLVTVVDRSGQVGELLLEDGSLPYAVTPLPVDSVLADADCQTILVLGKDVVNDPKDVILYTRGSSSIELESLLREDLKNAIENVRLRAYSIENLDSILDEINADVAISAQKIDAEGNTEASDALTGYLVGIAMAFILYMFIVIYGQLVMMSIIEEKNNRVLELIVTSVKPTHLMLGKIIGVGAVAVTQVLIWAVLITGFISFVLPEIMGPQLSVELEAFRNGTLNIAEATTDLSLLQTLAMLSSLGFIFSVFGYLVVYLVGGFFLYASIYAAIGAAVDNAQDGAQLQVFAIVPIIVGLIFSMSVGANPDSELATILSIVPFTSPMVMMSRIPSGVPTVEIALSIGLLILTIALAIWFTAKIYRVGIFMYGKKPTVKELIKWARYK